MNRPTQYELNVQPEGSMFKANFDDENMAQSPFGMEFHEEKFDSSWDTNQSFEQAVVSPASLSSFRTPRKKLNSSFEEMNNDPSPRIVTDQTPFRNRFASAALVSQQTNARAQVELSTDLFHSQDESSPSNRAFVSPLAEKSTGPLSPNDDSYVSFGNQSVFSDITESGGSITSVSRDLRRKARESKKATSPEQQLDKAGSPRQQLFKVHEEADDYYDQREGSSMKNRVARELIDVDYSTNKAPLLEEKKISSRLASFFTNRSLSRPRTNKNYENRDLIGRSLSVSSERPIAKEEFIASEENSESSGGYVRWPGTLDRHGNTVVEISCDNSAEDMVSPTQALTCRHHSIDDKMAAQKQQDNFNRRMDERDMPSKPANVARKHPARSRVADLKKQFERKEIARADIVDLDEKPTTKDVVDLDISPDKKFSKEPKPSDYHLAAAIATARSSPVESNLNLSHDEGTVDCPFRSQDERLHHRFPGALDRDTSLGTERLDGTISQIDATASLRRMQTAGKRMPTLSRNKTQKYAFGSLPDGNRGEALRLSEAVLRQQDRFTSSLQNVAHGANVKGYRGFINKTADVPNLMDGEIDSVTSASTMATNRRFERDDESDVFDGLSSDQSSNKLMNGSEHRMGPSALHRLQERHIIQIGSSEKDKIRDSKVVKIKNNISAIQTTSKAYDNRITSEEFDEVLTESDTDYIRNANRRNGEALTTSSIIPGHYDQISFRNRMIEDSSSSDKDGMDSESDVSYDLSKYAIEPQQVRKLVKAFRNMSNYSRHSSRTSIPQEESKKSFALVEMRSRIMETDIERGFDRAGGTVTVDDIVITSYYKASCRVRDAVIVSKAWRDGASPQDARTALQLTQFHQYYIERSNRSIYSTESMKSDVEEGVVSHCNQLHIYQERVGWIDDTEFSLIRCFGSKTLRGISIFTLGDCQSMLLKLTHENCLALKKELNDASSRQLIAEQLMKNEGGHSSSMTDAELEYLASMEDVKTSSKKVVSAERAFAKVRSEIESQVEKLECILKQIDHNSGDASICDSSASDSSDDESCESRYEKELLARRVQKAELRAEVAFREAQSAKSEAERSKQEAEKTRLTKQKELEDLQKKLSELEAKSSIMASDFEAKLKHQTLLANKAFSPNNSSFESITNNQTILMDYASSVGTDPEQTVAKERVKAKFRSRRTNSTLKPINDNQDILNKKTVGRQKLSGNVHQRLEFYERSLQAIKA